MTDYKALCAELIDHARLAQMLLTGEGLWDGDEDDGLLDRARAALAEPDNPTDEHILRLAREWNSGYESIEFEFISDFARAVLDRWGHLALQSEPEGPTDEELDELFTEIDQGGEALSWRAFARAVLARWGQP